MRREGDTETKFTELSKSYSECSQVRRLATSNYFHREHLPYRVTSVSFLVRLKYIFVRRFSFSLRINEKRVNLRAPKLSITNRRATSFAFYRAELRNFYSLLLCRGVRCARSRESAILRREINWNNAEHSCSLPTQRSEEFVNDRKAARSYLRTCAFAFSARE